MSMEHAILGFLTYDTYSGYDLQKLFDDSVGHFWSATQSQIYRTLNRMETDGWVSQEVIEQHDRPDRKIYHITDIGRRELTAWLSNPAISSPYRHPWLLQVFFAHNLSTAAIQMLLLKRADYLRQQVKQVKEEIPDNLQRRAEEIGSLRKQRLWELTMEYGVDHLEWEIDWLEKAARSLRDLPPE